MDDTLAALTGRPRPRVSGIGQELLERKIAELEATQLVTIETLARTAEYYAPEIEGHLERIRMYTWVLAGDLTDNGVISPESAAEFVVDVVRSSVLHDVGKIGIPREILEKPGRLTPEERAVMQTHAEIGARLLGEADGRLQGLLETGRTFITMAQEIAQCHHERWDGGGYPRGLAGTDIPLAARIVALADVYDALTSRRTYKEAWPHAETLHYIAAESRRSFDPAVVEAFLRCEDSIAVIRQTFRDAGSPGTA